MTHEELLEIVEPLRKLTDLQVYQKLAELNLPPGARDRVLQRLDSDRTNEVIAEVFRRDDGISEGATIDDLIGALFGTGRTHE